MRKLLLMLTLLIPVAYFPVTYADEDTEVLIDAKVYKINSLNTAIGLKELLAGAKLEHNPRLLVEYGKQAGSQFNYKNDNDSEGSILEVLVLSDKASKTYNIDINLLNGDKKNISSINNHPIGKPFIASTIIDNASRVIQIDVSESQPPTVNYLLQVSSDLGCDVLTIELSAKGQSHNIEFTKSAFASVALPAGEFSFGNVMCRTGKAQRSFDVLQNKLMPLTVKAGQTYFGGRLIFKESEPVDGAGNVLDSCSRFISVARGKKQDNPCDGAGLESTTQPARRVEVFMPDVSEDEINVVRKALSADKDSLKYLPLQIKQ